MSRRRWNLELPRNWNPAPQDLPVGAHLVFERRTYEHHALHLGDGRIAEYSEAGVVRQSTIAEVRKGSGYWALSDADRRHPALFDGPEAVARIRLRLGERQYNRGENNCEHLVNWALSGHHHCDQTELGVVYVGLGFVSWLVYSHDERWHRRRLASTYPHAHRNAIVRQTRYDQLRALGLSRSDAAATTRTGLALQVSQAA
ncbi:MAG: lecithin retinol acyltransferase family protein [Sporichthyaceae bacterium]